MCGTWSWGAWGTAHSTHAPGGELPGKEDVAVPDGTQSERVAEQSLWLILMSYDCTIMSTQVEPNGNKLALLSA